MSATALKVTKKERSAFYEGAPQSLFVSTDPLLDVHFASRSSAIEDRAKRHPQEMKREDRIAVESTVSAIADAAGVTDGMISKYLRRYGDLEWFEDWFLRGENPPANIRVTTSSELEKAAYAFDYRGICEDVDIDPGTFDRWFRKGYLPPGFEWVDWLYGGQNPQGWLIITEAMEVWHDVSTQEAIANEAVISPALVSLFKSKHPEAFKVIVRAAYKPKSGRHSNIFELPILEKLNPDTKASMEKYFQHATLEARSERAKVKRSTYIKWKREARDVDANRAGGRVLKALSQFLNPFARVKAGRSYHQSIFTPGLYRPPEEMRRFRKRASERMAEQNIRSTLGPLPCFQTWMADWATPMISRGRRSTGDWNKRPERPGIDSFSRKFDGKYPDGRLNLQAIAERLKALDPTRTAAAWHSWLKKRVRSGELKPLLQYPPPKLRGRGRSQKENTAFWKEVENLIARSDQWGVMENGATEAKGTAISPAVTAAAANQTTAPPAPAEPAEEIRARGRKAELAQETPPAKLMSASELARSLGVSTYKVRYFLDDYCKNKRDSVQEVDNPRRNEPKFLYRTQDVWPALVKHFRQR